MKWYVFLVQYWAQLAFVIAAVGYVVKVALDFRYKRKEIGYNVYMQARLNSFTNFFATYTSILLAATEFHIVIRDYHKHHNEFEKQLQKLKDAHDNFHSIAYNMRFLLSASENRAVGKMISRFQQIINVVYHKDFNKRASSINADLIKSVDSLIEETKMIDQQLMTELQHTFI